MLEVTAKVANNRHMGQINVTVTSFSRHEVRSFSSGVPHAERPIVIHCYFVRYRTKIKIYWTYMYHFVIEFNTSILTITRTEREKVGFSRRQHEQQTSDDHTGTCVTNVAETASTYAPKI